MWIVRRDNRFGFVDRHLSFESLDKLKEFARDNKYQIQYASDAVRRAATAGKMNPQRRRNLEGFEAGGVFHPIRGSKDYDASLGDKLPTEREWEVAWHKKDDAERTKRLMREHKSLSQFVRGQGGIAYRPEKKGTRKQLYEPGDLGSRRGGASELGMLSPKETGTTGLLNKSNKQGAQRYSAEYMMDAANDHGYRDRQGHKFTNIGNFLAAVADDVGGKMKLYPEFAFDDYYENPQSSRPARYRYTLTVYEAGKVHEVLESNSLREAMRAAQQEEAEGYQVRVRNNTTNRIAYRSPGLKKNPEIVRAGDIVEIYNVDTGRTERMTVAKARVRFGREEFEEILAGYLPNLVAVIVEERPRKERNPNEAERKAAHKAARRFAGQRSKLRCAKCYAPVTPMGNAAHWKKAHPGRAPLKWINLNPSVTELAETFQGKASGKTESFKAANSAPGNLARIGKLVFIKLAGRSKQLLAPGAMVAVDTKGKLWIVSNRTPLFNRKAKPGERLDYGEIDRICYLTTKAHIEAGKPTEYVHAFGEDGGARPRLLIDSEGMPILRGGSYEIKSEGIVN